MMTVSSTQIDSMSATGESVDSREMLLEVRGLKTHFFLAQGIVRALEGVDFTVRRGQTVGLVGESGCGKSITARSIMAIVPSPGRVVEGEVLFHLQRQENGSITDQVIDMTKIRRHGYAGPLHPRRRDFHGLSGADDLAKPGPHNWQSDY